MTIPMKAIEQYFHVVQFIMRYKVVLTFMSVDETPVFFRNLPLYSPLILFLYICHCRSFKKKSLSAFESLCPQEMNSKVRTRENKL